MEEIGLKCRRNNRKIFILPKRISWTFPNGKLKLWKKLAHTSQFSPISRHGMFIRAPSAKHAADAASLYSNLLFYSWAEYFNDINEFRWQSASGIDVFIKFHVRQVIINKNGNWEKIDADNFRRRVEVGKRRQMASGWIFNVMIIS